MTRHVGSAALELVEVSAAAGTARLLDRVSFTAETASVVAIAGPTGAGKTSLVRAITGMLAVSDGVIRVNGRPIHELSAADREIGYVPQDDVLHDSLTVRLALDYAAELRLPASADATTRAARVREVLHELRLQDLADQQIRSLSAGQRKRVAIATELITKPTVLVLDEPTSSLDPGYEASVMASLRGLADRGHCVVMVTHSVTAMAAADQVVYLARGGWPAFAGSPADAASYFRGCDVPALFTELDRASMPRWRDPHPPTATTRDAPPDGAGSLGRRTGPGSQLATLARRYATQIRADRRHATMLALQGVFLGVLMWAFVSPDGLRPDPAAAASPTSATGVAVLLALCMTWLGSANAIREIVKERPIFERERRAGLSVPAYVWSKLAVLGPVIAVDAVVLAALGTARQGVPAHGAALASGFVEVAIAVALAGLCAVSLALLVSAAVRTADKAVAALPVVVVTEFVLSGLRPSVGWVPGLLQLRDLASAHWAVTAIEATVAGDPAAWWSAIAAMVALTVAATVGATCLVARAQRLEVRRPTVASRIETVRDSLRTHEPIRLVAVGVRSLAAVAVAVTGLHLVGVSTHDHGRSHVTVEVAPLQQPLNAPAAAAPASEVSAVLDAGSFLPGTVGQTWREVHDGLLVIQAATLAAMSP